MNRIPKYVPKEQLEGFPQEFPDNLTEEFLQYFSKDDSKNDCCRMKIPGRLARKKSSKIPGRFRERTPVEVPREASEEVRKEISKTMLIQNPIKIPREIPWCNFQIFC